MAKEKQKINWGGLLPILLLIIGISLLNAPVIMNETKYIDYSSENIQKAIKVIEAKSSDQTDKIIYTASYVHDVVTYESTGPLCIGQSASDVLTIGTGDCVSTSKLTAAILSGMDIPVKLIEGCVFDITDGRSFKIPEDPYAKNPTEGRSTGPHNGQLHNWIQAYNGQEWFTIETTAGAVFKSKYEPVLGYNNFREVSPNNPYDLCMLTDPDYVNYCLQY